jgi:hypothetical protein
MQFRILSAEVRSREETVQIQLTPVSTVLRVEQDIVVFGQNVRRARSNAPPSGEQLVYHRKTYENWVVIPL